MRLVGAVTLLAGYMSLVVWLTWPLGARVTSSLPDTWPGCRIDTLLVGWALSHESRALLTGPAHFADGGIYHPTPDSLFYGDAGFGAVPYFLPVFALSGNPTLAVNLTFLGCIALTAWTLHLVVHRWTGSHVGGLIAACTFLATRWVLWTWIPAMPSYAVLQYLPIIMFLSGQPSIAV